MTKFAEIQRIYDKEKDEHRQVYVDIILHACDIGNPTLDFPQAKEWAMKIIQEFND
jgi:hypothetical protein